MPRYADISMPRPHALALLTLVRFAAKELERGLTFEERKALESLEYSLEGRDRRAENRRATPKPAKGKRMGFLDVRKSA